MRSNAMAPPIDRTKRTLQVSIAILALLLGPESKI